MDEQPTEVSGAVAIPPGDPPKGGWPILAFGQGTKGVLNKCASSLYGSLPLNAWTMSVFVRSGFLVTVSDFQGAGVEGLPASVPERENPRLQRHRLRPRRPPGGRGNQPQAAVLRAPRWVGSAVWSAAEQASTYGQGLDLLRHRLDGTGAPICPGWPTPPGRARSPPISG